MKFLESSDNQLLMNRLLSWDSNKSSVRFNLINFFFGNAWCRTPGQALASGEYVWLLEANKAPSHVCTRADLAKVRVGNPFRYILANVRSSLINPTLGFMFLNLFGFVSLNLLSNKKSFVAS